MTKQPLRDAQRTAQNSQKRRRVVARTCSVDAGEGKRIWKRNVDEYEFEGYAPIEIAEIGNDDLAATFAEEFSQLPVEPMSETSDIAMRFAAVAPRPRRRGTERLTDIARPSMSNTFLAVAALAITAARWVGLSTRLAAILGAVAATVLTAGIFGLCARARTKGS